MTHNSLLTSNDKKELLESRNLKLEFKTSSEGRSTSTKKEDSTLRGEQRAESLKL